MSYLESLRPASFRGVQFELDESKASFGRRNILWEYPQRDKPYVEDNGRKAPEFAVDGYVIEPDYLTKRDRLHAALEQGGVGTLIHPFYGSLEVSVEKFDIKQGSRRGGIAEFSIIFIEHGVLQFPSSALDTTAQVSSLAESARAQISADFTQRFSLLGQPDFVSEDAKTELKRGFDGMKTSIGVGA